LRAARRAWRRLLPSVARNARRGRGTGSKPPDVAETPSREVAPQARVARGAAVCDRAAPGTRRHSTPGRALPPSWTNGSRPTAMPPPEPA